MKLLRLVRGMAQSVYDSYQQAALFEDAFGKSGGALAAALAVNKLWTDMRDRVHKALPHTVELDSAALAPNVVGAINRGHTLEVERTETAAKITSMAEQFKVTHRELLETKALADERLRVLRQVNAIAERPFDRNTLTKPSPRWTELREVLKQLAQFTAPTPPDDAT